MPDRVRFASSTEPVVAVAPNLVMLRAEEEYHDCLARFGADSAEAHVTGVIWRQLRRRHLQADSLAKVARP